MSGTTEQTAELRAQSRERVVGEPVHAFPMEVRYSRKFGYLEVRDVFTGFWHEIPSKQAPDSWRRIAAEEKKQRKLAREAA